MPPGGMGVGSGAYMAGVQTPSLNSWVASGELFSLCIPSFSTSMVAESTNACKVFRTTWGLNIC